MGFRPVTEQERDKALKFESGQATQVHDPLMNPNDDEEEKRNDALQAEKLRVQQVIYFNVSNSRISGKEGKRSRKVERKAT
jgi:hypothetical protein